uniref:Uncharacterized protein n=1 Tax=Timema douglasi TaxID=61478 RepID=A0A7R8W031_TIMDO|nr:unnamed protein product [Timema douglasi]
MLSGLTVPAPP